MQTNELGPDWMLALKALEDAETQVETKDIYTESAPPQHTSGFGGEAKPPKMACKKCGKMTRKTVCPVCGAGVPNDLVNGPMAGSKATEMDITEGGAAFVAALEGKGIELDDEISTAVEEAVDALVKVLEDAGIELGEVEVPPDFKGAEEEVAPVVPEVTVQLERKELEEASTFRGDFS